MGIRSVLLTLSEVCASSMGTVRSGGAEQSQCCQRYSSNNRVSATLMEKKKCIVVAYHHGNHKLINDFATKTIV